MSRVRSLICFDPAIVPSGDAPSGWIRGPSKPQPRIATHEAPEGLDQGDCRPGIPLHGGFVWNLFPPSPDQGKGVKGGVDMGGG